MAGHYVFSEDTQQAGEVVWTGRDAKVYTHMVYLKVAPTELLKRRAGDTLRTRGKVAAKHLEEWQNAGMEQLREVCYQSGIPFIVVQDGRKDQSLVEEFVRRDAGACEEAAVNQFRRRFNDLNTEPIDTVLVFDADKTLSASDAGQLFCEEVPGYQGALHKIFSSSLEYSPNAFYQATLLFEQAVRGEDWDTTCDKIAARISIHQAFVDMLRLATEKQGISVVVVTCGIGDVWKKVMERHGLSKSATVVGGGRLKDGIVTPDVKKRIVQYLQKERDALVWAFGDSQLDLKMLEQADQAIVVVCDQDARSKSMECELTKSVTENGLFARQMLLPSTVEPRLNGLLVSVVHPADITVEIPLTSMLRLIHATNRPASKMLAAPTRAMATKGVALQQAHRRVGYYLATELLPKATGLERYDLLTVLNKMSSGHRIRNERDTVIVSCMRAGDLLAQGVLEALPSAACVHAQQPGDLENTKHAKAVRDAKTILLCDHLINSGATTVEFVEKIRKDMGSGARIVMVAGVVQANAVKEHNKMVKTLRGYGTVGVVALRLSENSYQGKGGTDTGSRLFNTTEVEGM